MEDPGVEILHALEFYEEYDAGYELLSLPTSSPKDDVDRSAENEEELLSGFDAMDMEFDQFSDPLSNSYTGGSVQVQDDLSSILVEGSSDYDSYWTAEQSVSMACDIMIDDAATMEDEDMDLFVNSVIESVMESCCFSNSSDNNSYADADADVSHGEGREASSATAPTLSQTTATITTSIAAAVAESAVIEEEEEEESKNYDFVDEHPAASLTRARHTFSNKYSRAPRKRMRMTMIPVEEATSDHSESSCSKPKRRSSSSNSQQEEEDDEQQMMMVMKKNKKKKKTMNKKKKKKQKKKEIQKPLPKESVEVMELWLDANLSNPYPNAEEKNILVAQTGLRLAQVANWLANTRAKLGLQRKNHKQL